LASDDFVELLDINEFAFRFAGGQGVAANDLGDFLRYLATLSKRQGVSIEVVGLDQGSLIVRLRARVSAEFKKAPIGTSAAAAGLLMLAPTLLSAFHPTEQPSPIAKVAIKMVEEGSVDRIELVTEGSVRVVMDQKLVNEFRKARRNLVETQYASIPKSSRYVDSESPEVRGLVDSAEQGKLIGEVFDVAGILHFRPNGFRYLVPINIMADELTLRPGVRYQVKGEITTIRGRPDAIDIGSAWLVR